MVNFTLDVIYHHHNNKNNDQKPKVILPKLWKWQVIFIYNTSFTIIQNSAAKSMKCWMGHFRSGICAALETSWRPAPAWNPWSEQTMATGLAATPFLMPNLFLPRTSDQEVEPEHELQKFRGAFQSCSATPAVPYRISPPVTWKEVSCFCTPAGLYVQGCAWGNLSFPGLWTFKLCPCYYNPYNSWLHIGPTFR